MAKRKLTEKEILNHLHTEGFKKIEAADRNTGWYRKASEKPECLKEEAHIAKANK